MGEIRHPLRLHRRPDGDSSATLLPPEHLRPHQYHPAFHQLCRFHPHEIHPNRQPIHTQWNNMHSRRKIPFHRSHNFNPGRCMDRNKDSCIGGKSQSKIASPFVCRHRIWVDIGNKRMEEYILPRNRDYLRVFPAMIAVDLTQSIAQTSRMEG